MLHGRPRGEPRRGTAPRRSLPWPLKLRILGPEGHLANEEAGRAIRLLGDGVREVLLAHLSQENNTPSLALETVAAALDGWKGRLYLTYPDRPSVVVGA